MSGKRISDGTSAGNDLARWADVIIKNGAPVETRVKQPISELSSHSVELLDNALEEKILVLKPKTVDKRIKAKSSKEDNSLMG